MGQRCEGCEFNFRKETGTCNAERPPRKLPTNGTTPFLVPFER